MDVTANAPRGGRPPTPRDKLAGERLRQALRLLGKTWRKNTHDPDHIRQWPDWEANGLPRSATTIDADIRLGVPEERLAAYEHCLGLPLGALGSPDADIHSLLRAAPRPQTPAPLPVFPGLGPSFHESYLIHNNPEYLQTLHRLTAGVYRAHYVLHGVDAVFRCVMQISDIGDHHLTGRGFFMMFGMENVYDSSIFRWHNNLHTLFLCKNRLELGHYLSVDPLRHNLVARRDPFWLKGQGVTDRGLADNAPIAFNFRMEMLPRPEGASLDDLWEEECEDLRRNPKVEPGEPAYEDLRAQVLEPDTLV